MERQRITIKWEAKMQGNKAKKKKKKKNPSLQLPVSVKVSFLYLLKMAKLTGQTFGVE